MAMSLLATVSWVSTLGCSLEVSRPRFCSASATSGVDVFAGLGAGGLGADAAMGAGLGEHDRPPVQAHSEKHPLLVQDLVAQVTLPCDDIVRPRAIRPLTKRIG